MRKESHPHKESKQFWASLGRILGFDVKEEDNVNSGFVDVSWKKENLFIAIEIECGTANASCLNLDKFEDLNPKVIIIECFHNSTAKKIRQESKKYGYEIRILNHKLPDNYKYFTDMNTSLNAFIRYKKMREEFFEWIHPQKYQ